MLLYKNAQAQSAVEAHAAMIYERGQLGTDTLPPLRVMGAMTCDFTSAITHKLQLFIFQDIFD